ncbi:MAG: DUF2461 domain-containing protein [Balneolaceae bacterium]|nr:DUF2461 domain-containing protein [Balneolaceae bacterium]MBO6545869.1 DUF2461 domain-containing protein [Balneolaceae bacterium]MBO6647265.1 DUF2461 domain-containing protein [Balneolaceae bacterium]
MSQIQKKSYQFLEDLKKNNNREWFTENKPIYLKAHQNIIHFIDALIAEMKKIDNIENDSGKKAMFRIYRDVRFAKDKSPYKTHFAASLKRATRWLRGGYYIHFEPGKTFIAAGFWQPDKDDIKLIRDELSHDANPFREIINNPGFKKVWGELEGETVKTAPRGYAKDDPNIDLIRHKGYIFSKQFTEKEVFSEDFVFEVTKSFLTIRPFFDYMSEVLTRHFQD